MLNIINFNNFKLMESIENNNEFEILENNNIEENNNEINEENEERSLMNDNIIDTSLIIGRDDSLSVSMSVNLINNIHNDTMIQENKLEKKDSYQIQGSKEEEEKEMDEHSSSKNLLTNLFRESLTRLDKSNELNILRRSKTKHSIFKYDLNKKKNIKNENNFNDIITEQLTEVKENILNFLTNTIKELEKRYSKYIKKMNDYINENEIKISKVFPIENKENILNYTNNNIFKQIDNLLEIHDNIFSTLEDSINILYTFLEQSDLIKQKNPLESFISNNSNEILNCWILNKFDFNKLNLSNIIVNKDFADICQGYLCKKKENKFASISIEKNKNGKISIESEFLRDNLGELKKLKLLRLNKNDVSNILNKIKNKTENNINNDYYIYNDELTAIKLKKLSIFESDLTSQDLPNLYFPSMKKLKIKRCSMSLLYLFDSIIKNSISLQTIELKNCKMNDKNFLDFFSYLAKNKQLQDSLEYLNFSKNELTTINLQNFIYKKNQLKNLLCLDFSNNEIYEFKSDNFFAAPKLEVLDLSNNNFSNYIYFQAIKGKKTELNRIIFMSNNLFINNNVKNKNDYINYLTEHLSKFRKKIKRINLSFLYNVSNNYQLSHLRISPEVKISLKKINLSLCGLKNEIVCQFIHNNFGLFNLEYFNLSNNFLNIEFFNEAIDNGIVFEKLKVLDLSSNKMNFTRMDELNKMRTFIDNQQKIKTIKFKYTSFLNSLSKFNKSNEKIVNNFIEKLNNKKIKIIIESGNTTLRLINDNMKEIFVAKQKSEL